MDKTAPKTAHVEEDSQNGPDYMNYHWINPGFEVLPALRLDKKRKVLL